MRLLGALVVVCAAAGCATNPYTGRDQLMLLDEGTEMQLGSQAYQEALAKEGRLTEDPRYAGVVERVAKRLAAEMEKGWEGIAPPGFEWEFHTVDDPKTVNAWCLPGGKICVYTGIFPACADENGLAVVLGHEIMHAVLHHGNERISQGMVAGIGSELFAALIGGDDPENREAVAAAFGILAGVGVLLPFSREQETESDKLGLKLAARAGYDPRAGIEVWKRMEALGGGGTPEFLSTHPSHETRIENMEAWMPEMLAEWERSSKVASKALPSPGGASIGAPVASKGDCVAEGAKRQRVEEKDLTVFEFRTQSAVYVEAARVTGPGVSTLVEAKTGVPANQLRGVPLEGAAAAGEYQVDLTGRRNGKPWTQTLRFKLN